MALFRRKRRTTSAPPDLTLQQIDEYERCIVLAHDQKAQLGVPLAEIERQRPGVVALARAVTDRMRADYLARTSQP